MIKLTLITSIYPACITKEFSLNTELKLNKKTSANLSEGKVEIKTIDGLGRFKNLLMNLNHNQCLVYGLSKRICETHCH